MVKRRMHFIPSTGLDTPSSSTLIDEVCCRILLDVQDLALAQGIKDSLEEAGFDTVDSILKEAPLDISNKLGIEPYVAQIIKEVAKRATEEESYEKETK